jgi:hypothetical protein
MVDGKSEHHPEGAYYLRVKGGRSLPLGRDATLAELKRAQVVARLNAQALGPEVKNAPP